MSDNSQPMQASGGDGHKGEPDGVGQPRVNGRGDPGESGGGAYPNPHTGKAPSDTPADLSAQPYTGGGQIRGEKADKSKSGRVGQGDTDPQLI